MLKNKSIAYKNLYDVIKFDHYDQHSKLIFIIFEAFSEVKVKAIYKS